MNKVDVFLKAFFYVESRDNPPYYLESKIWDLSYYLTDSDIKEIYLYILQSGKAADIFRYLQRNKSLSIFFPELSRLSTIKQQKSKSRNAFEHTLNVLSCVPVDDRVLRHVAVMHDLGKFNSYLADGDFKDHARWSTNLSRDLCFRFDFDERNKILAIVANHMFPLDYQRNPNWTNKGLDKFIARCGSENAVETVQFAIYDKMAENNVPSYLQPLEVMKNRIIERIENGFEETSH